ncbi:phosphoenolpyruvate-utilizing N-terminal domain-containing protein, partial [Marinimicrobium sp. UBA4209]
IAHAEATGVMVAIGEKAAQAKFAGVSGASGIAMGEAVVITPPADLRSVPYKTCTDVEAELAFFQKCLQAVRED